MVADGRLVDVFLEFARTLTGERTLTEALNGLCRDSMEVLPLSGAVVLVTGVRTTYRILACAGGPSIAAVAETALAAEQGPTIEAIRRNRDLAVPDFRDGAQRWPVVATRALDEGICSAHSFLLPGDGRPLGALTLYRDETGELAPEQVATGRAMADVTAAFLLNGRTLEEKDRLIRQLQHALDARVLIEQAKGALAERLGVDPTTAFERLRSHARSRGRRVRDVAGDVLDGVDQTPGEPATR